MIFYPYFPQFLLDFSTIRYEKSAHISVEHLQVYLYYRDRRPSFSYGYKRNCVSECAVKSYDILRVKNASVLRHE